MPHVYITPFIGMDLAFSGYFDYEFFKIIDSFTVARFRSSLFCEDFAPPGFQTFLNDSLLKRSLNLKNF